MDIIIYQNGKALDMSSKWSHLPNVGDEILVAGMELKIKQRLFRAGADVVELHLESNVNFAVPDLISKDDPDYQIRAEILKQ